MKEPSNGDEWQMAVDCAAAALSLDLCGRYGLIECDWPINVDRCAQLLEKGRRIGITPMYDGVDRFASDISRMHRWGKKWRHHHAACQERIAAGQGEG